MGTLEMPMPDLGKGEGSLEAQGRRLERRIRSHLPREPRDKVTVAVYADGERTGLRIEFDDRAEQMVLVALEYPPGSDREECEMPSAKSKKPC